MCPSHSGQVSRVNIAYLERTGLSIAGEQSEVPAQEFLEFTTIDKTSLANVDVGAETEVFHLFDHTGKSPTVIVIRTSRQDNRTKRYSILQVLDFHSV